MSLQVTIRFTGQLRALAGQDNLVLSMEEGATLDDVLDALRYLVCAQFTEQVLEPLSKGKQSIGLLMLNRVLYSGAELDHPLSEDDVVAFVMPMEGG